MLLPLRDENPTYRFPLLTILFIGANVSIYLYGILLGDQVVELYYRLGTIPIEITTMQDYGLPSLFPIPLSIITSMFMHGGFFHLLSNMLYLWIFGNNVEDVLGPIRFILFYSVSGIIAAITHIVAQPYSEIPMVGASGAIAGILGAYMVLFPQARIKTLIFIIIFIEITYIRAFFLLGFWFLMQVFNIGNIRSGVAWFAHIGGFVFGFFGVKFFLTSRMRSRIRHLP